jgi:hypothetical protein
LTGNGPILEPIAAWALRLVGVRWTEVVAPVTAVVVLGLLW